MKTTTIVFFMCLMYTALSAQELSPFQGSNGKYGYRDENRLIIIPAKYDNCASFREGKARVAIHYDK